MRFVLVAVVGVLALPGVVRAASPAVTQSTLSSDAQSSAKPAKSRPRNAVDRSSSDPGAATFSSFDTNNDGYLSREEALESAELSRRFDELDRNRDGRLSLEEVTGWRNVSYRKPAASKSPAAPHVPGEEPGNIPPTAHSKRE